MSVHTVSEQLLYEMGTPQYLAPDCIARFDSIRLTQDGPDRVKVSGIVGEPPPEKLKVSVSFSHGYRAFGRLIVSGPDTLAKAEKVAEIVLGERRRPRPLRGHRHPVRGLERHATRRSPTPSRARSSSRWRCGTPTRRRSTAASACRSSPGCSAPCPASPYLADQGRPRASDVVGYWPALIDRDQVPMRVVVGDDEVDVPHVDLATAARGPAPAFTAPTGRPPRPSGRRPAGGGATVKVPLGRLCLARSGDKGDTSNVGVIARSAGHLRLDARDAHPGVREGPLRRHLPRARWSATRCPTSRACNFLLHESLGGGGTLSLLVDAQGKTYAQYLLATEVEVDAGLLDGIE